MSTLLIRGGTGLHGHGGRRRAGLCAESGLPKAVCRKRSADGDLSIAICRLRSPALPRRVCRCRGACCRHNEIEDAEAEHIAASCNLLMHAMLERAGAVQQVMGRRAFSAVLLVQKAESVRYLAS